MGVIPTLSFFVAGEPQTAGSKKGFVMRMKEKSPFLDFSFAEMMALPQRQLVAEIQELKIPQKWCRAIITDDNPAGDEWKREVRAAFEINCPGVKPLAGALQMDVTFILARPKSHFGTGRNADQLKPSAQPYHITRPDTTKLLRCLEDALTGYAYEDDGQIVAQHIFKEYGHTPGARIDIGPFDPPLL